MKEKLIKLTSDEKGQLQGGFCLQSAADVAKTYLNNKNFNCNNDGVNDTNINCSCNACGHDPITQDPKS